jgi:hypothetical protein
VRQTLTTVHDRLVFDTTKTARSQRRISLDAETVAALRRHRARQAKDRLFVGEAWDDSHDLVFTQADGTPVHPDRWTRQFQRHVARLGLPELRGPHSLRHTWATLALEAGVHPEGGERAPRPLDDRHHPRHVQPRGRRHGRRRGHHGRRADLQASRALTTRLVFVDESERRARYLMCAVTIAPSDVGSLRRRVRKLLLPGQSQLHFKNESARRRRSLAGELVAFGLDIAVVSKSSEPGLGRSDLRDRCLAELIADAQDRGGAVQMYLESRHHQDEADHASFSRWRRREPPLNYEHVEGAADPLLWLPDAFAWLAGAGGEWTDVVRPALRRRWEAG